MNSLLYIQRKTLKNHTSSIICNRADPKLKDVLLATTAAPTYFKAVTNASTIETSVSKEALYAYVDGGLGANRPAYEALKILKGNNSRDTQKEILDKTMVCSLNFNNTIDVDLAIPKVGLSGLWSSIGSFLHLHILDAFSQTDGKLGWANKGEIVDRIIHINEENGTSEVKSDLPGIDEFIEIKLPITKDTSSLDNAKVQNIVALEEVGRQYIKEHEQQIQKLCDNLFYNCNQEQNIPVNADTENVLDDMIVANNNIDKLIISD